MQTTIEITATHARRRIVSAMSTIAGIATIALAVLAVLAVVMPAEELDCSVEDMSSECRARLPEELQNLPPASLGVWYYADNFDVKQSPRRYLEGQSDWGSRLPPGTMGSRAVDNPDGKVPSQAALEGELRMRNAVLPEIWNPPSRGESVQALGAVLGLGAVGSLVVAIVTGLRSRKWEPIPIVVTAEHVSIGGEKRRIEDLMTIEVAPLRLGVSTEETDLELPEDYDLDPGDHEALMEVLQAAMAEKRDILFDDD